MKKFRKIVWKIWIRWLVLSIPINAVSLLLMLTLIDSDTPIPAIIAMINGSWLLWLSICNTRQEKKETKNETRDKENSPKELQRGA